MPGCTRNVYPAEGLTTLPLEEPHRTVPSWPAAPNATTAPVLALYVQGVVPIANVWPCAAAIVKLPLIVRALLIVSVAPASSSPPEIVSPPGPNAVGLLTTSVPALIDVPPV